MNPDSMDAVFAALAHAARRKILDIVRQHGGCNVNEVASHFKMSRIAVMKHLRILEDANLLISEKDGRDRRIYFNAAPIQMIYDRWTTEYSRLWGSRLTKIKYDVEADHASRSTKEKKKSAKPRSRDTTSSRKGKRTNG